MVAFPDLKIECSVLAAITMGHLSKTTSLKPQLGFVLLVKVCLLSQRSIQDDSAFATVPHFER